MTPTTRLAARAVLVGVIAILINLQGTSETSVRAVVSGALLAGVLAAAEVLTPLNASVGLAKAKP